MARRRFRKGLESIVRHTIRQGIREGLTKKDVIERVEERHGIGASTKLHQMLKQEEDRQKKAGEIMDYNKSRNVDLAQMVGCTPDAPNVRAYITIRWRDGEDGPIREKGTVVNLDTKGRLSNILNKAIGEVREFLISLKYEPPELSSADKRGSTRYRVEYIECA